MQLLNHARKKTTQKVNLYEKVQIPGFQDAIRKINRFLEDEENLSKSSQKIVKKQKGGSCLMIVPIRKYTFLVYHRDYDQFLDNLGELGVLHIVEKQTELDEKTLDKLDQLKQVNEAISFLKTETLKKGVPKQKKTELSWPTLLRKKGINWKFSPRDIRH